MAAYRACTVPGQLSRRLCNKFYSWCRHLSSSRPLSSLMCELRRVLLYPWLYHSIYPRTPTGMLTFPSVRLRARRQLYHRMHLGNPGAYAVNSTAPETCTIRFPVSEPVHRDFPCSSSELDARPLDRRREYLATAINAVRFRLAGAPKRKSRDD